MIDITGLREDKRPQSSTIVHALLDRLEAAEADALEQARLNGMGSEREAALMAKLEAAEKEREALRAKIARMEKTWLSPEGYHILMQEREDILFQAEKMKQRTPCKDISMWPTHHTQPTQPAPSAPSVEVELWRQNVLALVKQYGNERATEAYHGDLHCRKAPKDVCTEIERALDAAPKQEVQPAPSVPDGWETDLLIVEHAMRMNNWDWNSDTSDDLKRSAYKIISKLLAAPEAKP